MVDNRNFDNDENSGNGNDNDNSNGDGNGGGNGVINYSPVDILETQAAIIAQSCHDAVRVSRGFELNRRSLGLGALSPDEQVRVERAVRKVALCRQLTAAFLHEVFTPQVRDQLEEAIVGLQALEEMRQRE